MTHGDRVDELAEGFRSISISKWHPFAADRQR